MCKLQGMINLSNMVVIDNKIWSHNVLITGNDQPQQQGSIENNIWRKRITHLIN